MRITPPAMQRVPAVTKKALDPRCESIEEHVQLGEKLNDEERAFFSANCQ